jgi:hypothetical protein
MNASRKLDLFTRGLLSQLIDDEVQRELKKKACPVCRDSGTDKRTGKDCFYCKKS